jgi:putative ABC transport system permease protein
MPSLTWADAEAIHQLPAVKYVSPQLRSSAQVVAEEQNWQTGIYGVTPEFFDIRNWQMASGARFSESDVETGNKVVVIGKTVVTNLWGEGYDPVGESVRIKNVPFTVVGVLAAKGQSQFGQDYDDGAYIPVSTFRAKIQGGLQNYVSGPVFVGATSGDQTTIAQKEIESLLRERHQITRPSDDDFTVRNLTEIASAQEASTQVMTSLLLWVAIVSLVVGGIGIMNIMLVSVTERTREIGIRMAVGAKPKHILAQFLVESVTLSMMGGLTGVTLGVGLAYGLAAKIGWPLVLNIPIVALSFTFAAVVGVVFGLYPSWKASRLDPIDALRYE